MSKLKAFLIHLGISGVIYVVLLSFILFYWYPHPYFGADGGWQGVRILTGVDLVLGPLLTLIVYKSGKPGLKIDLTLIGIFQIAALTWGMWIVYEQRTALVTFADGSFYSLTSEQIEQIGDGARRIVQQTAKPPAYALVSLPPGKKERRQFTMRMAISGIPLFMLGHLYEPITASNLPDILSRSVDIEAYARDSADARAELNDFLHRHGQNVAEFAFLPLKCRYQDITLVLRRSDGQVLDSLNIPVSAVAGK